MAFGSVANYLASGDVEVLKRNGSTYVKVYNSLGSALSEGHIVRIFPVVDTAATPDCVRLDVGVAVTNTAAAEFVGVVDNSPFGKSGIADASYGWVCVEGQCEAMGGATISAANKQIEVLSGTSKKFIDAGATTAAARVVEALGFNVDTAADATLSTVYLYGVPVATKSS